MEFMRWFLVAFLADGILIRFKLAIPVSAHIVLLWYYGYCFKRRDKLWSNYVENDGKVKSFMLIVNL